MSEIEENPSFFEVAPWLQARSEEVLRTLAPVFERIERVTEYNQQKVLAAFIRHRVSESHFTPTTGYGYGDRGRETLDAVFADVMGAEDALVRHSIVSGTHAITIALFALLRPGDTLLAATGAPYDTLDRVIGAKVASAGSLAEYGIGYREVPLTEEQTPDLEGIRRALAEDASIRVVHIQRSRGYDPRPSLSVEAIGRIVRAVRSVRPDAVIFADNCYGDRRRDCGKRRLCVGPGRSGGAVCLPHDHARSRPGGGCLARTHALAVHGTVSRAACGG